MASRRVIYTLLEPVTRPYFAPYRHNYNQRQHQKRQQALQRRWITNGVQEWTEEDVNVGGASASASAGTGASAGTTVHEDIDTTIATPHLLEHHNQETTPWYLRNNDTIKANETLQSREPLPEFPENCPLSVETFSKFMIEELGLTDLQIIDLRNVQPSSPFGTNTVMILSSGKSSRHLNKAGQSLIGHIKQNYNQFAETEGILSSNFLKVYNRRLRKKAQRQGTANRDFLTGSEDTMVNRTGSWVVLDTKVEGVYIHLFTEERRSEVDLEGFWTEKKAGISELVDLPKSKFEKRFVLPGSRRNFTTSVVLKIGNAALDKVSSGIGSSSSSPPTPPAPTSSTSAVVDDTGESLSETQDFLAELQQWSLLGDYRRCIRLLTFAPDSTTSEELDKAHGLILKAHINDLSIKQKNGDANITPSSDIISSFVNNFPTNPTALQYRLRLIFLQKLHTINEKDFPLTLLVEHIVLQQASGIAIESWDVEMIVATIAYSNQFNDKRINSRSISEWEAICTEKLKLVLQVHEVAYRSTGEILSASDSLLKLLYRLCFSLGKFGHAVLPAETVQNPSPHKKEKIKTKGSSISSKRAFIDSRSSSLYGLFGGQGGVAMTKPLVILIMTVLINGGSWNKFWSLWSNINRFTIVDQDLLAVMVSLVTKTGNQGNIIHMLERYLPNLLPDLQRLDVKLSPETVEILNASLQYLDPVEARYHVLRDLLKTRSSL